MATQTVEERLTELETKVAYLENGKSEGEKQTAPSQANSWLAQHFGAFKDSPYYDAAMELGAEYRRSQPAAPDGSEDVANAIPAGH